MLMSERSLVVVGPCLSWCLRQTDSEDSDSNASDPGTVTANGGKPFSEILANAQCDPVICHPFYPPDCDYPHAVARSDPTL